MKVPLMIMIFNDLSPEPQLLTCKLMITVVSYLIMSNSLTFGVEHVIH